MGLAVAGAVCAGVSMLLDGGVARTDPVWGGIGVAGVGLAALLVLGGARRVGGVVAGAAAGFAGFLVVTDVVSGVAGPSSWVLLVGAVATLLGAVTRDRRGWVLTVVSVLVVAAAGFGVRSVPDAVAVESGTVAAQARPEVVDRPRGEPWRWTADAPVVEAVVAGTGLVVGTDAGQVVAVGAGGRRLWHYTRAGTDVTSLATTPDQALVVATFSGGGPHARDGELSVLLDAATGDVLREWAVRDHSALDPLPSNSVLPVSERFDLPDHRVDHRTHGTDLRTGERLWTWQAPAGCLSPWGVHESGADVVIVSLSCQDDWGVVALGDRDGVARWQRLFPVPPGESSHFLVNRNADGTAVSVHDLGSRRELLRTRDGSPVAVEALRGRWLWANAGQVAVGEEQVAGGRVLSSVAVDPADGSATVLAQAQCAGRRTLATTATAVLRLCFTDTRAELTRQELGGSTVERTTIDGWTAPPGHQNSGSFRGLFRAVGVLPAPGFLAIVRRDDPTVLGYPG
ncbi:hypothetical protein CLV68_3481 [Actinokineospora cianjurensis]|uniref:Pyrroloquinoline-quinone binding quinoprotein n=2 Tax=Actinokineospora cianjurensis TaxID=585224 RepID=A0A421B3Y5_9PSEU|nr:hypothetical protein CLV68_3481 [Actinokineospora cianjurensis]